MQIVRKPVAFNRDDPDQAAMLEHAAQRPNFSGYVKRLIQRDMEGSWSPSKKEASSEEAEVNRDLMAGLI